MACQSTGSHASPTPSKPDLIQIRRPSDGDASRRSFLSLMGFSMAAAGLSACRAPVQHAIPLGTGSDTIVPGVPSFYATTCGGCAASCALLVKQRDGRPIKIEGNPDSPLFGGGTCAVGQATVLSLYDDERLRGPLWAGHGADWNDIDRRVVDALAESARAGRKIVLLSGTITSPTTREIVAEWGRRFPTFRHVVHDSVSFAALREANRQSFGRAVIPHYAFDKARVIVALEADFLGTWLSPVEFARQYALGRKPDVESGEPLHVQVESGLSVTGSNADVRIPAAPSELGGWAVALLARLARQAGVEAVSEISVGLDGPIDPGKLDKIANALWQHRRRSLVVSGSRDLSVQLVVNALNQLLGNVGETLDLLRPSLQRQGDDAAMTELLGQMEAGDVGTLIIQGVNPVYDHPGAARFKKGLTRVGMTVSLSDRRDETSAEVHAVCPDHHFLEAWNDAEPVTSYFSLAQPVIAPLFKTRGAADSLLRWLGADGDYYTRLRDHWRLRIFPALGQDQEFGPFWDRSLERGVVSLSPSPPSADSGSLPDFDVRTAAAQIAGGAPEAGARPGGDDRLQLHLYQNVAMHDGRHANNPWLQELPDPITTVTWGNFAAVAPAVAHKLGLEQGDVVLVKAERGPVELPGLELPILVQPGQHAGTVSVALGYGRRQVGKAGNGVGGNAFPLLGSSAVTLAKTGRREPLATTQSHFTIDDSRTVVLETTLDHLRHERVEETETLPDLWAKRLEGAHSWGMAIDINACTGCSACVVGCQSENNVPVVGKDQVQRSRIMHWLRVDHYYSGPTENPSSVHQPMMCQHCDHAPCETVCPVLATTTSSEGINQQVYNRCIGTRYCANNCPYKVRRFNWYNYTENDAFDFNMRSPLGRMALNPDVTVRSRGVMEKCSLCVQRVQLAKNTALQDRREMRDGDVQTACQQACPTGAIVFGDLMDPESRVSRLLRGSRAYRVLEDLGTRPHVGYLKKVKRGSPA